MILEYFRTLGSHVSYDSLKTVAGWTIATEDEKTVQWLAVLEPDQRRERTTTAAAVEQQHCSAHWWSAVLM